LIIEHCIQNSSILALLQKKSPAVETAGLKVKALISSFFKALFQKPNISSAFDI
jgi:hypothetical protein